MGRHEKKKPKTSYHPMTLSKKQERDSKDTRGITTTTNPNINFDRHFNGFYCGTPKSRKQISHHSGC